MITFRHAGDIGDIIYSLPVIRHFGGGILYIEAASYTRQKLTPDKWCGLDLLLKKQHYIAGVQPWNGQNVSINLNDFRAQMHHSLRFGSNKSKSLVDWMLETHGVPSNAKDEAWLQVEPKVVAPVVINRTGAGRNCGKVYCNPLFPWHRVWMKYREQCIFIGLPEEHEAFCATVGDVHYYPTDTLLEAAQVVAGSSLFVGNQSCCHAIAEGLKKRILLEVWLNGPNCLHYRDGVVHGFDNNVELPSL